MAGLPPIAEGPTAEEQMLIAEASSVSRQTDLQTLRHDKREFIKVSLLKSTSFRSFSGPIACMYSQASTCVSSLTLPPLSRLVQANRRALAKTPKFGETFGQVQSSDLPPQFRALLEDNRVSSIAPPCQATYAILKLLLQPAASEACIVQSRHNLLEMCAETHATMLHTMVSGRCYMSKCGPTSGSCMRLKRLIQLTTGMWCGCKQKRSVCMMPCRQGKHSFSLTLHMIVVLNSMSPCARLLFLPLSGLGICRPA